MGFHRQSRALKGSLWLPLLLWASALGFSISSQAQLPPQSRLREKLKLPPYLDQKYGLMSLEELQERLGTNSSQSLLKSREDLARGFWKSLVVLDPAFAMAVEALPAQELERVGVEKFLAQKNSNPDSWTSLWWDLKFHSSDRDTEIPFSSSKSSMILVRQYGFASQAQGDWMARLQDKLNMGHTALAFRQNGAPAQADLYFHFDDETESSLETYNFWQWTQTQIELRFTKVDLWVTPLSRKQDRALQSLLKDPELRKIFRASLGQDPSHKILSFLSPIHLMHEKIVDKFFEKAHLFQFPDQSQNNPHAHVPDVDFRKVNFANTESLSTFRDYRAWEQRLMQSGPVPASLHP